MQRTITVAIAMVVSLLFSSHVYAQSYGKGWTIHNCSEKPSPCLSKTLVKEAHGNILKDNDRVLSPSVKLKSATTLTVVVRETMPGNPKFQPKQYEYEMIVGNSIPIDSKWSAIVRAPLCDEDRGNCYDWEERDGKAPVGPFTMFLTQLRALASLDRAFAKFF